MKASAKKPSAVAEAGPNRREKVLVVEDEADILQVIQHNLAREGYRVCGARDGEESLRKVREEKPDLILLDLMIPGIDGIEVCRLLKADPLARSIPVIMVTARTEESDIILGLGVGADDYITKPFSPRELVARVKAVLRRGILREETSSRERIAREDLIIDAGRHEARVMGTPVSLTATEFRLLHFLASHPGRVFTRDQLLGRIADNAVIIERNIDVHIRSIRKKLGRCRDLIETIRRVGYRFRDDRENG